MKNHLALAGAVCVLCSPLLARAESTTINPAAAASAAAARLDFKVTVPAVLYLRVGTGAVVGAANDATVNLIDFAVPAANLGDGTSVAASAGSGDLTNGAVTVRLFSNFGTNVSLNSAVAGQLLNAAGDVIPWTQIAVASAALAATTAGYTNTGITHPAFSATNGNGTATTLTAASRLVRQEGKWTFTFANTTAFPAGTYGAAPGSNGRVTYTATQL
jgi:hypothetical protein